MILAKSCGKLVALDLARSYWN